MSKFIIISDGQTKVHRIGAISDDIRFPKKGTVALEIEFVGYCKSNDEAVVRIAKEKKKIKEVTVAD